MTTLPFREDAYLQSCGATVLAVNERGGIVLDTTVFYATAGGQPGDKGTLTIDAGGRIDFDIPEGQIPGKQELAARINAMIAADHKVTFRWITGEEMSENQHLIRTMSVKPPMGTGRVRLVMIGDDLNIDLQPCGGTHVRSTIEIGPIAVAKIENKGKINRRIRLAFA